MWLDMFVLVTKLFVTQITQLCCVPAEYAEDTDQAPGWSVECHTGWLVGWLVGWSPPAAATPSAGGKECSGTGRTTQQLVDTQWYCKY